MNPYGAPPGTYGQPPPQQQQQQYGYGQQPQQQYGQGQYGGPPQGQYSSPSDFLPQPNLAPTYGTQYPGMQQPMAPPPVPAPQQHQYPPQQQYPQQPYGQHQQQQQYGLAPPPQQPPQYAPPPQQQYSPPPQQYAQAPPPQQYASQVHVHHHHQPAARPVVAAAQVVVAPIMYHVQVGATGLDRKDVFSKSDPFLIISAKRNPNAVATQYKTQSGRANTMVTGDWVVCHKTETIMNNHRPVWKPFQLDLRALCNGNMDQPFLVECFDWDANSRHDFIGSVQTTVRECQIMKEMHLRNPKRKAVSKVAGTLQILRFEPANPGAAGPGMPMMH